MAKAKKIEVDGKEYILAFPTRKDAENAEKLGFCMSAIESQPLVQVGKLFFAGLVAKHESMTLNKADEIREKFVEEGGDLAEINTFLIEEYSAFFKSPTGKKKKKIETVEI